MVQEWLSNATNDYEVLPRDADLARRALHQLQVTTRSPMGAVVFETGGILIDNGWLRILGSGHSRLTRSPAAWTQSKAECQSLQALLIADDASGGFFAVNGGGLGEDIGCVYYFAPDSLEWESLEVGYSAFLQWALCGDLALFYQTVRWNGWGEEPLPPAGDEVYAFFPFLWTEPHLSVEERSRSIVPIEQHWRLTQELKQQLI
ncbi:hypothetical protein J2125_001063 [Erwinia toletana]|uniref:DUF2625 domain-containing protein n=2 Tax=Winslowiella toletana TaxID=92490 RepID=A0ABS4P5F8_9GAMM|nr:hypothetical protein [Winslowiella toletana]